jgi:hypothetical protein
MSTIFLKLEASTGTLYENSKEPREGFTRVESQNPTTKVTVVSYRRYLKYGVFGRLQGMYLKESKFDGKVIQSLCVNLVDGEERFGVDIPYKDQKGNINSFAESFILHMPFMQKDEAYCINPYAIEDKESKTASGKARKKYGVALYFAQLSDKAIDKENRPQKLQYSSVNKDTGEVVERDVPLIEWEENFDGGVTMNKNKRNKFLHETMQKYSIEYSGGGGGMRTFNKFESQQLAQDAPQPENVQKVQEKPAAVAAGQEEDDDDLPF